MNDTLQKALDAISATQPKNEGPVWMVGEQLKDILRESPQFAQIVLEDFTAHKTALKDCEEKIRAHAKAHGGCCTPKAADKIIREHFGLSAAQTPATQQTGGVALDLSSFL